LFDDDGYLYGSDNSSMLKYDYKGNFTIVAPSMGVLEQFAWLPDGDIVYSSQSSYSLGRLDPDTGATSTLSASGYAYGLIVGADEMIYTADNYSVYRVDPDTGSRELIIHLPGFDSPRVLVFNEDESVLFIGTLSSNGTVFSQAMDSDHEPVGSPVLYASGVGGGYHDGIGVDVCGNVYVTDYTTSGLYRIAPGGTVTTLLYALGSDHGHGMAWGSGIGGWKDTALYMPQPYNGNKIMEIGVGVPAKGWTGTVLNKP
jgi:streptogramin lyase